MSSTSSSSVREENGKTSFTETDTFDFEFDINLIAEEMGQCNSYQDIYKFIDTINSDSIDLDAINSEPQIKEESVDLTQFLSNDVDLRDILTNGHNPMLSNFSEGSIYSFSQPNFTNELPLVPDESSIDDICWQSQQSLGGGNEHAFPGVVVPEASQNLSAKRTATTASLDSIAESVPQKSSKLLLNINQTLDVHSDVLNTPEIINVENSNSVSNISTHEIRSREDNINTEIYAVAEEPTTREEFTFTDDNTTTTSIMQDFSAPGTPNSSYSVNTSNLYAPTCQTGFAGFITAPASPAVSTTSTVIDGSNTRKRGRPAKDRAEGPDEVLMSRMTEEEVKVYLNRIRNNEASRISRKKNKLREAEEIREEEALRNENDRLKKELKRLKDLVKSNTIYFHRSCTYIKPKQEP